MEITRLFFIIFSISYFSPSSQFFFPTSSSSSCCACGASTAPPPIPSCAPQPTCPPIVSCPTTTQTCCSTCSGCKNRKMKREVLSNSTFVAESESELDNLARSKREILENMENNKCNSDELRDIIEKKIDRVTAIAKRRIQEEAESRLNGRFNVICARGDFSYIANTELFCQHTVGDVTCFLFRQLSDVVRRRLA